MYLQKQSPCNFRCEMSIRHCMQHETRQILASVCVAVVCDHFPSWQKLLVITLALVLFGVGAGDCEQPSVLLNVILKLTRRTKILKGQYVVNCCGEQNADHLQTHCLQPIQSKCTKHFWSGASIVCSCVKSQWRNLKKYSVKPFLRCCNQAFNIPKRISDLCPSCPAWNPKSWRVTPNKHQKHKSPSILASS